MCGGINGMRQELPLSWASVYLHAESGQPFDSNRKSEGSFHLLIGVQSLCVVCAVGVAVPNQRAGTGCSLMIRDRGGVAEQPCALWVPHSSALDFPGCLSS